VTSFWGLTYIGEVLGEEQAGFYAVPLKVYQISLVVGMSVTAVTLPLYHRLAASGQFELYARIFGRLVCGLWLIGGVIVATCYFIPEFIIIAFANEQYMPAAAIFPWIGFGILLRLLAIPAGNILESVDKQWYRVGIQVIGAIICVLAVSFVVPRWGIVGAAWTLFATDLWTLMAYWFTSRHFATAVVSLRDLLIPCSVLVALLLVLSHCPVVVCLRVLLFCGLWIAYVIAFLNGKEEIRSILAAIASRGQ
jgi:O-antigen/teichoic acid export membrane protein